MIIGAYYVALKERPDLHPRLLYWPIDSLEIGVVHIGLTVPDPVNATSPTADDASTKLIQPDPATETAAAEISLPAPDADRLKKTE